MNKLTYILCVVTGRVSNAKGREKRSDVIYKGDNSGSVDIKEGLAFNNY